MPPSHLETLPEELLYDICERLDSRKQSLRAFALASRTCHAAALPTICRRICLINRYEDTNRPSKTPPDLLPRIDDWLSFLDRRRAGRHVRSIVVTQKQLDYVTTGLAYPEYLDTVDRDDVFLVAPTRECDWDQWSEPAERDPATERCDIVWERLSTLIDRLPALASFTWDCSWPLPEPVIAALRLHPLAKWHLHSFWFADEMRVEKTNPPDLTLLSDSRIRSIRSRSIEVVGYREGDNTHEVILDLVTGINPHVRPVSFLAQRNQHSLSGDLLYLIMKMRQDNAPWPGLSCRDVLRAPCARLQSLEMGPLSLSLSQTILQKCDLTDLKVLKLIVHPNYKGLDHIASSVRFPRLRSLGFGSERWTSNQESEHGERNLAVPFLNSLPALEAIRFTAQVGQDMLESTIRRHGPSLRRLWFAPPSRKEEISFDRQQVAQIQQSLPMLEDLSLSIRRSLGDESEVAIYRCLGSFPRLSTLSLYLDCDDTDLLVEGEDNDDTKPVLYADVDDFDKGNVRSCGPFDTSDTRKALNGHVRHALMNAALDQHLALAIFDAIATSKTGGASDVPLQRLELRPIRGEYFVGTREILAYLSQWWLVEALAGGTGTVDPIITPIYCHGDRELQVDIPALPELEPGVEPIFRKIWSSRSASDNWYYDWRGLPLQT